MEGCVEGRTVMVSVDGELMGMLGWYCSSIPLRHMQRPPDV
jgi:hypothetical protein